MYVIEHKVKSSKEKNTSDDPHASICLTGFAVHMSVKQEINYVNKRKSG